MWIHRLVGALLPAPQANIQHGIGRSHAKDPSKQRFAAPQRFDFHATRSEGFGYRGTISQSVSRPSCSRWLQLTWYCKIGEVRFPTARIEKRRSAHSRRLAQIWGKMDSSHLHPQLDPQSVLICLTHLSLVAHWALDDLASFMHDTRQTPQALEGSHGRRTVYVGVSEIRGTLLKSVVSIRDSFYLGIYLGGSPILVNPNVHFPQTRNPCYHHKADPGHGGQDTGPRQ